MTVDSRATPSKSTAASAVYEAIRGDILGGRLEPALKLRIEFICERYGAGASPVREALSRLSSEGLVDRHDQRGFYVAPVSLEALNELVKTRCWLESLALREAIANRTADWEDGLVLAHHRLSRTPRSLSDSRFSGNREWDRLHRAFHKALIAACGSQWLLRFCADLADHTDRYRLIAAATIYPRRNEGDEHRAIMDATIDGRTDEAVALLEAHYRKTQAILEEHFRSSEPVRPIGAAVK